jgi:kynurenine formamidase
VPEDDFLQSVPTNWQRWGSDDEIGALNFLDKDQILKSVRSIRQGKVFSLGLLIGRKGGDPVDMSDDPKRSTTVHLMTHDEGTYKSGKDRPKTGGLKFADDAVFMFLQGTTHCDALGHVWTGDKIYNGYSSDSTIGGLSKASIVPLANKGIVGRGILLDVGRCRGLDSLSKGEPITLDDILMTAENQKIEIQKHDIILVRTGFIRKFYENGPDAYYYDLNEPGIAFSEELVRWFSAMEISAFGADTLSAEQTRSTTTEVVFPLHLILLHKLGIPIQEILWLEDLAQDCFEDKQYDFFYVCSPLKFEGGTGSPINPIAIK